jgi:hypothetical protein
MEDYYVKSEVPMAVTMKFTVFRNITLDNVVDSYQYFR